MGLGLIVLFTVLWATEAHSYVRVWGDRLSLSAYVAAHAPQKPRALMNYGVLLVSRGSFTDGAALLTQAAHAAQDPHVPVWDRRRLLPELAKNQAALAQFLTP